MKRTILTLFLALCVSAPLFGQSGDRSGHFFAGYAFARTDTNDRDAGTGGPIREALNMNGFNVAFGGNLGANSVTDEISLTVDVGGYFSSLESQTGGDDDSLRLWTLTAGPQFTSYRHDRLRPFVRALFGVSFVQSEIASDKVSDTGFAFIGGGGLDVQLGSKAAFRVFQVDYLLARHSSENINTFRVATGIAVHF